MPFKNAHFFVLALLPASLVAFWPGFFAAMSQASLAVHLHGWSATAWVLLLALQSWSIHNERYRLHRVTGKLSLVIFPLFLSSFLLVIQSEAQTVIDGHPYRTVFAPGIGVLTLVAFFAIGFLYSEGLKNRGNAQLHARYLLAIPFLFTESIFGRIFNAFLPGLIVYSLDDIRNIYWAIHLSQVLAIALAAFLYLQNRKFGAPFIIVSIALILQSLALEIFDGLEWWRKAYLASVELPFAALLVTGLIVGAAFAWRGWAAGKRL